MPIPRRWRRRGAPRASPHVLLVAAEREFLTPRASFGPSHQVYGRVHLAESGVYLLVAAHLGDGDPVVGVGWARNDYRAVRVWGFDGHAYRNDQDETATGTEPPSLEALGWPTPMMYADMLAAAKRRSGTGVMVSAAYRFTDGGFQSHVMEVGPRCSIHYGVPNPGPSDLPVAVELGLGGPRWDRHLEEVRRINREAGRRR